MLARVLQLVISDTWHPATCMKCTWHHDDSAWHYYLQRQPATCYQSFASFWLMCSESGNDYMTDLARVHVARRQWRNTELWHPLQWGCPKKSNGDDMTTWVSVGAHYIDLDMEKANEVQQWRLGEALEAVGWSTWLEDDIFWANRPIFSGARLSYVRFREGNGQDVVEIPLFTRFYTSANG